MLLAVVVYSFVLLLLLHGGAFLVMGDVCWFACVWFVGLRPLLR